MPLESATKLLELVPSNPLSGGPVSEGDDHIRLIKQVLVLLFPVGSIIENTSGTNPGDYIGGTWSKMEAGRVTVSEGAGFTAGATGGAETHTLVPTEMAGHTHGAGTLDMDNVAQNTQVSIGTREVSSGSGSRVYAIANQSGSSSDQITVTNPSHKHTLSGSTASAGSNQPHNNMQPYVVVYRWERTA